MLQRWALELSAYDYDIHHQAGKKIPHADFLSRNAHMDEAPSEKVFFCNPMPISRNRLIEETRKVYEPILSALRNGWSFTRNVMT